MYVFVALGVGGAEPLDRAAPQPVLHAGFDRQRQVAVRQRLEAVDHRRRIGRLVGQGEARVAVPLRRQVLQRLERPVPGLIHGHAGVAQDLLGGEGVAGGLTGGVVRAVQGDFERLAEPRVGGVGRLRAGGGVGHNTPCRR
jgi:hypothetical protein